MVLENFEMRLITPPCNPSAETVNAIVETEDDLGPLLPYLNAGLGPGIYNADMPFLRLQMEGRAVTIHADKVAISKVRDRTEAEKVFGKLRELIRSVERRRSEITPSTESIGRFTALEVYKLLPQTNCGECGLPTCLSFAVAVSQADKGLEDCPPLFTDAFAERRGALLKLVGMES